MAPRRERTDPSEGTMICRIWHGWAHPERADAYERLLRDEVFAAFAEAGASAPLRLQLLRRDVGAEVEFTTLLWFDSLDAVRAFAGEDHERAVVPPEARALLSRFEERVAHYELRLDHSSAGGGTEHRPPATA